MENRFHWEENEAFREDGCSETMHSRLGPLAEARAVYLDSLQVREGLTRIDQLDRPLVVWDVGLGVAANVIALLQLQESLLSLELKVRPLQIFSFESKPEGLRFAYSAAQAPEWLVQRIPLLECLLRERRISFSGVEWSLIVDDFQRALLSSDLPAAELVFYDFYSPKVNPELWSESLLSEVYRHMQPGAMLSTYCAAGVVRRAMRASGFEVSRGPATPVKRETTLARKK